MFFVPGFLISILTFPGVILHEIAHRFFSDLAKVPVYQIKYFEFSWSGRAGYVVHAPTENAKAAFLISVGPLFFNTFICSVLTFVAYPLVKLDSHSSLGVLLLWVGLSAGMHAFPSNQDMSMLTHAIKRLHNNWLLTLVAQLFSGFFMLANLLRFFWFDLIYAVLIAGILPVLFGLGFIF